MNNFEKFLPEKYPDLPGSKPVEKAVDKSMREGGSGPQNKEERVERYLNRIDKIVSSGNKISDERGWELLKKELVNNFSINTKDPDTVAKIAHGLYESEKKMAIEQGRGADIEGIEQQMQAQGGVMERYKGLVNEKRDIQERTLTSWLDYLKQNDAQYPNWFRYYTVRSLQKMGTVNKEKGEYSKRTPHTIAPFPELNSEALGFTYRMLTEGTGDAYQGDPKKQEKLKQLLDKKDFAKLYAFAQVETAAEVNRESIQGEWKQYDQASDHHILEDNLRGKGTGWCTAEGSAYGHLQGGDFHVYYTKGSDDQLSQPRIAIRMESDQVAEVRGINHRQELEPELVDIAQEKYHNLPGGEKFDKKSADMKHLTHIIKKTEHQEDLTKDDLVFLYEIDAPIEGFGYEKDPRIEELRRARKPIEDMPTVFDCRPDQIATNINEISDNTRAYVGELTPGIFTKLAHIEHIYTDFPEGRIQTYDVTIGGASVQDLEAQLQQQNINTAQIAKNVLNRPGFTTSETREDLKTIWLTAKELGMPDQPTSRHKIYAKAQEIGLELCPAEVGPRLRVQYLNQPKNERLNIAMEPIRDSYDDLRYFRVGHSTHGLFFSSEYSSGVLVNPYDELFVFQIPKQPLDV